MKVPKYEEFERAVYESYLRQTKGFDPEEVKEYFKSDEAVGEIQTAYKRNCKKLEDGVISEAVFLGDGAASVAMCLSMMF